MSICTLWVFVSVFYLFIFYVGEYSVPVVLWGMFVSQQLQVDGLRSSLHTPVLKRQHGHNSEPTWIQFSQSRTALSEKGQPCSRWWQVTKNIYYSFTLDLHICHFKWMYAHKHDFHASFLRQELRKNGLNLCLDFATVTLSHEFQWNHLISMTIVIVTRSRGGVVLRASVLSSTVLFKSLQWLMHPSANVGIILNSYLLPMISRSSWEWQLKWFNM